MKVLIVDQNNTAKDLLNDLEFRRHRLFFRRLGADVTLARYTDITGDIATEAWDLVIFPIIAQSVAADSTNIATVLTATVNARCAFLGHVNIAAGGVATTGYTSGTATTAGRVCDVVNWKNNAVRKLTFYGKAATALAVGATSHFEDSSGNIHLWSYTISGIPTLVHAGHTTSGSAQSTCKFFLGAQWAVDHGATIPRKAAYLLRLDSGLSLAIDVTVLNSAGSYNASNALDPIIADAVATGYPEIQLAIAEDGSSGSDTNNICETYYTERDLTAGTLSPSFGTAAKIFRAHNHITDVVDGADKCTSNGTLLDQAGAALTAYRGVCDDLTAAGLTLGTDGYGAGVMNVQNSNYLNYPAIEFLNQQGIYPSTLYNESAQIPNDAVHGLTPTITTDEVTIVGGVPIMVFKQYDSITSAVNTLGITMNDDFIEVTIAGGGGVYFHLAANTATRFGDPDVHQEFFDYFVAAPDVLSGSWADQKAYMDALTGVSSSGASGGMSLTSRSLLSRNLLSR